MRTRILRHADHKKHKEIIKQAMEERYSAHEFYYEDNSLYCEHDADKENQMELIRAFACGCLYASRVAVASYEGMD